MNDVLHEQEQLQSEASTLLRASSVLTFLEKLGKPIQAGSSVTGLMVYPDIDFSVQNDNFDIKDAITLTPMLFDELNISALKIADFSSNGNESAGYYIGFEMPFNGRTWHIDATIGGVGPLITNPPELAEWIENMSEDERITILKLKRQLIDAKRYVGARSQPPYTFRSVHLYEAVLKGEAVSIADIEKYFSK